MKFQVAVPVGLVAASMVACVMYFSGSIKEEMHVKSECVNVLPADTGSLKTDGKFADAGLFKRLGNGQMNPTDPDLLAHLRHKWIFPPSALPYNLARPDAKSWAQIGQSKLVDKILKQRQNGFFIESGAFDGEDHSNSLFFEKYRGWQGLLIEPDPWSFETLIQKNRKAFVVNTCVAIGKSPERTEFTFATELGGISEHSAKIASAESSAIKGKGRIQCFPILSLLSALGRSHVDFFSLDVEGAEILILKSFPWNAVTVDVWTIEFAVHGGGPGTAEREKAIREIFKNTGLYKDGFILGGQDIVFVRKDVKE